MSEKINAEIVKRLPEPEDGRLYRIEKVEYVKTSVRDLEGWRVTLKDVNDRMLHATMLWKCEKVDANSKLGAFLVLLGNRTSE
ncbi:MAG: hypothetical protein QXF82_00255 [Nitrososphaeria archaeon]